MMGNEENTSGVKKLPRVNQIVKMNIRCRGSTSWKLQFFRVLQVNIWFVCMSSVEENAFILNTKVKYLKYHFVLLIFSINVFLQKYQQNVFKASKVLLWQGESVL